MRSGAVWTPAGRVGRGAWLCVALVKGVCLCSWWSGVSFGFDFSLGVGCVFWFACLVWCFSFVWFCPIFSVAVVSCVVSFFLFGLVSGVCLVHKSLQ